MSKAIFAAILAATLTLTPIPAAAEGTGPELSCASALLMEKETGTVLYEKDAHLPLAPASVTKIMTLLLAMEALDSGAISRSDVVTVSAAAAGMGGSQVYLKQGEQITVNELLKCVAVVSGNDCAVALAEHIAGSESSFVERMNRRAAELGMNDTHFLNCTGLPAPGHLTSAHDIALMSRELILNHPAIRDYTTLWMDSIRDGSFGLTNTNRLIRFYPGATGLKTGSTDEALYCMSATAERDGMELIAVVMKSPTTDSPVGPCWRSIPTSPSPPFPSCWANPPRCSPCTTGPSTCWWKRRPGVKSLPDWNCAKMFRPLWTVGRSWAACTSMWETSCAPPFPSPQPTPSHGSLPGISCFACWKFFL